MVGVVYCGTFRLSFTNDRIKINRTFVFISKGCHQYNDVQIFSRPYNLVGPNLAVSMYIQHGVKAKFYLLNLQSHNVRFLSYFDLMAIKRTMLLWYLTLCGIGAVNIHINCMISCVEKVKNITETKRVDERWARWSNIELYMHIHINTSFKIT